MKKAGLLFLAGLLAGCGFFHIKEQQQKLRAACTIKGTARSMHEGDRAIVVVLLKRSEGERTVTGAWEVVSHFVMESAGRFVFTVSSGTGTYAVGAFDDTDRDLVLEPGESFVSDQDAVVTCTPGARFEHFALSIPTTTERRAGSLDFTSVQTISLKDQVSSILGQQTAAGELTSLAEDFFSQEVAQSGLWRPFDFLVEGYAGIYFLEEYDPSRVPVLFVHGINGTPASFDYLVRNLDRKRFQPWVYYYPSGLHLGTIADHLAQTMTKIQVRYRVPRVAVVAHSMGGLVARGFVLRHAETSRTSQVPLLVTISTPWGGHKAAEYSAKAPAVVEVWRDMAPGSPYQRSVLDPPLPAGMQHHMVFTFQRNRMSFGESDDHGVTVASQLVGPAQKNAVRVYGFDDTHMGVLRNPEVSTLLNDLLAKSFEK